MLNRIVMERVRCLLLDGKLTEKFWAEATSYAIYIINRSPQIANNFLAPEESWTKQSPKLDELEVFGCIGYVHISQGKLKPRAVKCMFLGFTRVVKRFRFWHPTEKRCINSRDVIFREHEMFMTQEPPNDTTSQNPKYSFEVEQMREN